MAFFVHPQSHGLGNCCLHISAWPQMCPVDHLICSVRAAFVGLGDLFVFLSWTEASLPDSPQCIHWFYHKDVWWTFPVDTHCHLRLMKALRINSRKCPLYQGNWSRCPKRFSSQYHWMTTTTCHGQWRHGRTEELWPYFHQDCLQSCEPVLTCSVSWLHMQPIICQGIKREIWQLQGQQHQCRLTWSGFCDGHFVHNGEHARIISYRLLHGCMELEKILCFTLGKRLHWYLVCDIAPSLVWII